MINKCLFPAAGYGTRFLPATKAMPKEMLPILTKPLIQYGVEEALESGCHNVGIVTGRGKRAIEDYFDVSYELEHQISGTDKEDLLREIRNLTDTCTFSYTRQIAMKGLGDAILKGKTLIGDEPFAVILADDLCINPQGKGVLTQMVELYKKYQCCIVAIEEVQRSDVDKYGIIEGEEIESGVYEVSNMIEKPSIDKAPSNFAIIGRYILTPDIFDILAVTQPGKKGEIQITDALLEQSKKRRVLAYKFQGKRYDCGSIDGYVKATMDFYQALNTNV
ncbi:UTP--glucose-1-phosphate uridylyltransferase GalU [Helicobacter sp. MIT 21-1697]|uniref:UTP--glucose-1-phosphate uridylyltransferase GalU n=1 Tax=Helicobacter sp. MIT 21-1697 TaxID=2993733 RepID=UPI00224B6B7B|nr:UTP--glucose-1-phosphate uridylyltransferase GalU [Helicobacter sp. MIT 21-1697]MCX2716284.1 UTP--glucose-1-phosphate uridylyltransferase GalU [Helicobacter sp. MIT 21-1697]